MNKPQFESKIIPNPLFIDKTLKNLQAHASAN